MHALCRAHPVGRLTIVEGERRRVFGSGAPQATVVVRSPRAWPALARGGLGLAESYVDGLWDSPDLTAVIELAARNMGGIDELRRRAVAGARALPARPCAAHAQHARRARAATSPPTTTSATTSFG